MDPLRDIATDLTTPGYTLQEPDFTSCDVNYGRDLSRIECLQAANKLPHGSIAWPYALRPTPGFNAPFRLPISLNVGGCYISVEAAGPNHPPAINIVASELRSLAAITIQKCVSTLSGIGGFSTYGLHRIFDPLIDLTRGMADPLPSTSTFVTLTVSGPEKKLSTPGDNDPSIPLALAQMFRHKALGHEPGSEPWALNTFRMVCFNIDAKSMRVNRKPWWNDRAACDPRRGIPARNALLASEHMAYDCDANLGNPAPQDCLQMEWSQLPSSDTLHVGPGVATFLHQNSCYLAITASVALVLTWEQVRAAVNSLFHVCINHPYNPVQGGRAFYQPPRQVSGRTKRRDGVSGLNALPPHANITVFQQLEAWTDASRELKSCTWKAVTEGRPVSKCHTS